MGGIAYLPDCPTDHNLSLMLGALAASTVTPPAVHVPVKWLLASIRGIPLILVAMLMVGAVGLGPLPGILAIALDVSQWTGWTVRWL